MKVRCVVPSGVVSDCEVFPIELPVLPEIGSWIESGHRWPNGRLQLKVVKIIWKVEKGLWAPWIYLNRDTNLSLVDWSNWYNSIKK